MSMKINKLEIENVKRIKAVKVEPKANGLTVIGGNNNQGKTSVLDSIAWALGGERYKPSQATREGSVIPPTLHIVMNNGLVVERKGKNSALKVTDPKVNIPFGEYANPSFESQVETVAKAKQGGIMSIERCVEELYGDTLDDHCKKEEIARLKAEQGVQDMDEPGVNMASGDFYVDLEGGDGDESKSGTKNVPDEPERVPGTS